MTGPSDLTPPRAGRSRAEALVSSYVRWEGRPPVRLGPTGDVTFGAYGFRHESATDTLVGRVFIERAWDAGADEPTRALTGRMFQALIDPRIGGMFDHGGGEFHLDEERRAIFLLRRFDVASTSEHQFRVAMEHLRNVGATWTLHWYFRVARILHGWDPPPRVYTSWPPAK